MGAAGSTEVVAFFGALLLVGTIGAGAYFLFRRPGERGRAQDGIDRPLGGTRTQVLGRAVLGLVGVVAASPLGVVPVALGISGLLLAVGVQVLGLVAMSRSFRSHAAATLAGCGLLLYWGAEYLFNPDRTSRPWTSWFLMQQAAVVAAYGVVGLWRPGRLAWRSIAAAVPTALFLALVGITVKACR